MIARLVRDHLARPASVTLAGMIVLSVVVAPDAPVAMTMIAPLVLVLWRTIPSRPSAFEAALPVRGREVVLARALATLALMLLPITVWMIVATRSAPSDTIARLIGYTALGIVVVLLPYHVNRGALHPAPPSHHLLAWGGLAALGAAIILLLPPFLAARLLVLGAVGSVAALWFTIPDALPILPTSSPYDEPANAGTRTFEVPDDDAIHGFGVLRVIVSWRTAVLYPVFVMMGAVVLSLVFFCPMVLVVYDTARWPTRWLATLPLSHRARLLSVALPSVAAAVVFVGLGAVLPIPSLRWRDSLHYNAPSTEPTDHWYSSPTAVSVDHWRRVRGTTLPVITAPWGEQVAADTASVLGVMIYNPYTTVEHNSARFVAWQFGRLTRDVYGRVLTQGQYDTMSVHPRRDARTLNEWLVAASALLMLALLIAFLSELDWSSRQRTGAEWKRLAAWLAILPGTLMAVAEWGIRVRGADAAMPLLRGALRSVAAGLPANPAAALALASVPVLLLYALLERQFKRSEPALLMKESPSS